MIKMQLTMFDKEGHYKPISTIVEVESMDYYMAKLTTEEDFENVW